jgi:hypothetical protein
LGIRCKDLWKTTINDPNVLDDYHAILIPKAIKYSAGILDYFFRGRIEVVDVVWNATQYTITIRNQSGQELASGGKFFVLKDDANGNRSFVTSQSGVSLTQNVADNGTWQFNFPGPEVTTPTKFIVVYQGTVGAASGPDSDPVDLGLAIAAKQFTLGGFDCGNTPASVFDADWEDKEVLFPFGGDIVNGDGSFSITVTTSGTASSKVTTICNPGPSYEVEIRSEWTASGAVQYSPSGYPVVLNVFIDNVPIDTVTRDAATGPFTDMMVHAMLPASKISQLEIRVGFGALGAPSATYSGTLTVRPLTPP